MIPAPRATARGGRTDAIDRSIDDDIGPGRSAMPPSRTKKKKNAFSKTASSVVASRPFSLRSRTVALAAANSSDLRGKTPSSKLGLGHRKKRTIDSCVRWDNGLQQFR
mmetsp:Transcript_20294/g.47711  ORF Transcript_20294/g.47711 Transcript_20294/m.47711 type:complete len:108 (-) Transcript_20294:106-429(-)